MFGTEQQAQTSELIVHHMERMGYAAVNVTPMDLPSRYGPFERLFARSGLPFVSANIRALDNDERIFPSHRIIEFPDRHGGPPLTVGVIGISGSFEGWIAFGPDGRSVVSTDPADELDDVLAEIRPEVDVTVAIAAGDLGLQTSVLRTRPDLDILLIGIRDIPWREPKMVGRTHVFYTGDRGREVLRIGIDRSADGFEFLFENTHLSQRTYEEDPRVAALVEESMSRLNTHAKALMEQEAARTGEKPITPYVGVTKCAECHLEEYEIWSGTGHAHAMETLAEANRDYTMYCVGCHVTGMGDIRGGFQDPASTPALRDVQCESCHDAGEEHVNDPAPGYGATDGETSCRGCHDMDNSPAFDYDTYWPKIAH